MREGERKEILQGLMAEYFSFSICKKYSSK